MRKNIKRTVAVARAAGGMAAFLAATGVVGTSPAYSAEGTPPVSGDDRATAMAGNAMTCAAAGLEGTAYGLGDKDLLSPAGVVTYTRGDAPEADRYVDVTGAVADGFVVTGVVVKAGDAYNVYSPPVADMHGPLVGEGGNVPAISHWFACVDEAPVIEDEDPETGTDPDPGTGTDPETETDPDPETGTDPDPGTGTDPDPGTGTDPDPETETDPDPETETDPETGTDPDPDPETETETDPETGTDPDPDPGTGTDPDPETETDPQPQPVDPQTEVPDQGVLEEYLPQDGTGTEVIESEIEMTEEAQETAALPATGAGTALWTAAAALGLVVSGTAVVLATRRRKDSQA